MTPDELNKIIRAHVSTLQALCAARAEALGYLRSRWQDEQQREDIADYKAPVLEIIEGTGFELERMDKSPFGFVLTIEGGRYQVKITARGATVLFVGPDMAKARQV